MIFIGNDRRCSSDKHEAGFPFVHLLDQVYECLLCELSRRICYAPFYRDPTRKIHATNCKHKWQLIASSLSQDVRCQCYKVRYGGAVIIFGGKHFCNSSSGSGGSAHLKIFVVETEIEPRVCRCLLLLLGGQFSETRHSIYSDRCLTEPVTCLACYWRKHRLSINFGGIDLIPRFNRAAS